METSNEFTSNNNRCRYCGRRIWVEERKDQKKEIIVYTEAGPYVAIHKLKRCYNKDCRASQGYSYSKRNGVRQYDEDVLRKDIIVTTSKTGFQLRLLYNVVLLVFCG